MLAAPDPGYHRVAGWGASLVLAAACLCTSLLVTGVVAAQELEPGAYSPAPRGFNVAVLAGSYSDGNVAFDPAAPATDTHASVLGLGAGYVRTLGVLGRSASVAVAVPYVRGDVNGLYFGEPASAHRQAFGDPSLRLALNLYGAPAMSARDFAAYAPRTIVGASLVVVAPLGAYDDSRIINVGSHRWALRPELGVRQVAGRFTLESDAGVWCYTDNRDYRGGAVRSQAPIASLQAHVIYTLYHRAWLALDGNYYVGGRTQVNGRTTAGEQRNSRAGITLALPLDAHQSVKLAYSNGARVTIGGDFSSYTLTYQYGWLDAR